NMTRVLKSQLDKKYLAFSSDIEDAISSNESQSLYISHILYLNSLLNVTSTVIDKFLDLEEQNKLEIHLYSLIASFIHIHLNRLFKSNHRLHELVIYTFLSRNYKTQQAKQKHLQK